MGLLTLLRKLKRSDNEARAAHGRNVKTVYDLFNTVWVDSDRLPRDSSRMYVLKGRLLRERE